MVDTPLVMIQHLESTYSTLTPEELKAHCFELSKPLEPRVTY
jgi:hypothetical protein